MYSRYMHIYMLLILHSFPTLSFPRLPSSRYTLPDLDKVYCVQSGTWAYRGLGSIGGFVIGEKVIGDLGLSGSWD